MGEQLYANVRRDGVIEFQNHDGDADNYLNVLSGPPAEVRRIVTALARVGYDNQTLLVPGVPEADDDYAAVKAVQEFRRKCTQRSWHAGWAA